MVLGASRLRTFLGPMLAFLVLTLAALAFSAIVLEASDSSTVNHGGSLAITAHSTCRNVTNNSTTGASLYVPTVTAAEWASFYTNPPSGVTAGSCWLNTFTQRANMVQGRFSHMLVGLADGRALVCGGMNQSYSGVIANCEIYNPTSNTWTAVASMPAPLGYSTAVLLGNNRVLICGGAAVSPNGSCYTYDVPTNAWTQVASVPAGGRAGVVGVALLDGRALYCAGDTGVLTNRCDIYNYSTNTWTQVAGVPQAKSHPGAATLTDGRVLLCGGMTVKPGRSATYTNRCDIYNPTTNMWTQVANLPQVKGSIAAARISDGRVLMCGGTTGSYTNRCDLYNVATNTWTQAANDPLTRSMYSAAALSSGAVLVCGGYSGGMSIHGRCDIYQ